MVRGRRTRGSSCPAVAARGLSEHRLWAARRFEQHQDLRASSCLGGIEPGDRLTTSTLGAQTANELGQRPYVGSVEERELSRKLLGSALVRELSVLVRLKSVRWSSAQSLAAARNAARLALTVAKKGCALFPAELSGGSML
jgi:hypothetical protein